MGPRDRVNQEIVGRGFAVVSRVSRFVLIPSRYYILHEGEKRFWLLGDIWSGVLGKVWIEPIGFTYIQSDDYSWIDMLSL